MQDRSRRELSLLQIRAEKQQNAMKRFEEEALLDKAWDKLVNNMQRFSNGCSVELKRWIHTNFPTGVIVQDLKGRKKICEMLVENLSSGRIPTGVLNIDAIADIMEQPSAVTGNCGNQLKHLANSIVSLHNQLQSLLDNCESCKSMEDLLNCKQAFEALLQHPHSGLLSNDKIGKTCIQAANTKLRWLTAHLSDMQREADLHAEKGALKVQAIPKQQILSSAPIGTSAIDPIGPNAPSTSSKHGDALVNAKFGYIGVGLKSEQWLTELRASSMCVPLPAELEEQLQRVTHCLRYATLSGAAAGATAAADDTDSMMDNTSAQPASSSSSSTGVPLKVVESLLADLEHLLHGVVKGGPQAFLRIILALSDVLLEEVQGVASEVDVLMYAVVICGMFRALSANMHKQSARIFHGVLVSSSALCVPDLLGGANNSTAATRTALLFAALVGQSVESDALPSSSTVGESSASSKKVSSPLMAAQGWTWLYRAVSQLQVMLSLKTLTSPSSSSTAGTAAGVEIQTASALQVSEGAVAAACRTIRSFLRLAGNSLYCKYQDKFTDLLVALQAVLQPKDASVAKSAAYASADLKNLLALVSGAIQAKYIAPAFYRSQAPFMLDAASLTRYCMQCNAQPRSIVFVFKNMLLANVGIYCLFCINLFCTL